MPNTYTQTHIQFVFAVKHRQALIHEGIRDRIEKYMTGIVQNSGHKLLAIYCMPDHAHLFVGLKPNQSMADLMKEVKSKTTDFINKEKLTAGKFAWQEGYGAFSYSRSHVQNVIDYVLTQPEHHRKKTFKEEYLEFLKKFEVAFEERFLFQWLEAGSAPTEPEVVT
jgi:putative transposase